MENKFIKYICERMMTTLTVIFIISLSIIISFAATNHLPPHSLIAGAIFEAITNLAYGFAASYIFYLINVFLPTRLELKKKAQDIANLLHTLKSAAVHNKKTVEAGMPVFPFNIGQDVEKHYYNLALDLCTEFDVRKHLIDDFMFMFHPLATKEGTYHHEQLINNMNLFIQNIKDPQKVSSQLGRFIYQAYDQLENENK